MTTKPSVCLAGAAGFIGCRMVRCFIEAGFHVLAIIHRRSQPALETLESRGALHILRHDAAAPELRGAISSICKKHMLDLQYVVNAAGHASDVGPRDLFRKSNFELPLNLANLAMALHARRFVQVSTSDVYGLRDFHGETEDQLTFDNHRDHPYPEFKIKTERWLQENLPSSRYAVLRPAAVWGPDDPTLTQRFADFLAWSPWIIHFGPWRGANRWPLAHVQNVAMAAVEACRQAEAAGLAVNILDVEHTSLDEFYRIVADLYHPNRRYRTVSLPLWAGIAWGGLVSGVSGLLQRNRPIGDPSLYAVRSLAANLDFSNERFLNLLKRGHQVPISRDQAMEELRRLNR